MIIVNLYGGLGNQLFQYAAGRQLAETHHTDLKFDIDNFERDKQRQYCLNHFYIKESFCTPADKEIINGRTVWEKLLNKTGLASHKAIYTEQSVSFDRNVLESGDNVYLDGYWQSEKYFKRIEKIIRTECCVKEPLSGVNKIAADKIKSVNAVSIHIRRGDFITDKETNAYHGVCDISYYHRSIEFMKAALNDDPSFFIFSDDMQWTKANLSMTGYPVEYIDHNRGADYEDLRLMYLCKHNIIANSSFSWWGAWLNNFAGKKVIAPATWFQSQHVNNDIVPENWIKV